MMGRQLKEVRRALLPIAPQVADTRPDLPAPVAQPQPSPLPDRINQRRNALKGKVT